MQQVFPRTLNFVEYKITYKYESKVALLSTLIRYIEFFKQIFRFHHKVRLLQNCREWYNAIYPQNYSIDFICSLGCRGKNCVQVASDSLRVNSEGQ